MEAATPAPSPVEAAIPAAQIPEGLDPLAEGVLMAHQREWIEDKSPLKIAEKCRRSGFTFAEALDDTLTAATAREEGGDSVYYIGDTREKGLEFIGYCARFARVIAKELAAIEEFLFEDRRPDGETKHIAAYRIRFRSGHQIVALSSRPASVRGLQGVVVIDEAAFHADVGEVIDAAVALLIWGGRIRIISTHNGKLNAFNNLVVRTRAGQTGYSLHRIDFKGVLANGLYDRVRLMRPETPPLGAWLALIRGGYTDAARMREELDAIPRDAEGSALSRVQVEACVDRSAPVLRLARDEAFRLASEDTRRREVADWIAQNIRPVMEALPPGRLAIGADIARRGHGTVYWLARIAPDLRREVKLVVELRRLPFDQMRQILHAIFDLAGRRPWTAAIDAGGLGMEMAEAAALKYGARVHEVSLSQSWYREHGPKLTTGIEDRTISVPADEDVIGDLCALAYVAGVIRVPEGHETTGADGGKRHGDAAVAATLMAWAALQDSVPIAFAAAGDRATARLDFGCEAVAPKNGRSVAGWGASGGELEADLGGWT